MYADKQSSYGVVGGSVMKAADPYQSETATHQPEVQAEMKRLELATETLGKTAEDLTSRLEPVRSQTGSGEKTAGATPEPVLCNYAQAIRSQRQRVEGVSQMLQRALNELEI